jgi:hypothetical protein
MAFSNLLRSSSAFIIVSFLYLHLKRFALNLACHIQPEQAMAEIYDGLAEHGWIEPPRPELVARLFRFATFPP